MALNHENTHKSCPVYKVTNIMITQNSANTKISNTFYAVRNQC